MVHCVSLFSRAADSVRKLSKCAVNRATTRDAFALTVKLLRSRGGSSKEPNATSTSLAAPSCTGFLVSITRNTLFKQTRKTKGSNLCLQTVDERRKLLGLLLPFCRVQVVLRNLCLLRLCSC